MSSGDRDDQTPLRPEPKVVPIKPKGGSGGGSGGEPGSPCNIVERTKVNSPDATVAATLRPGDTLSLNYDSGPPKRLLVKAPSGAILGAITSPSMPQLIQCLLSGVQYDVIILSIVGGLIDVQVQPS